jgi:hypothetical protein
MHFPPELTVPGLHVFPSQVGCPFAPQATQESTTCTAPGWQPVPFTHASWPAAPQAAEQRELPAHTVPP